MGRVLILALIASVLAVSSAQACEPPAFQHPYAVVDAVAIRTQLEPFGPDRRTYFAWAQATQEGRANALAGIAYTQFRVVDFLHGGGPDIIEVRHPFNEAGVIGMCDWLTPVFRRGERYVVALQNPFGEGLEVQSATAVWSGEDRVRILDAARQGLENEEWSFLLYGFGTSPDRVHDTDINAVAPRPG